MQFNTLYMVSESISTGQSDYLRQQRVYKGTSYMRFKPVIFISNHFHTFYNLLFNKIYKVSESITTDQSGYWRQERVYKTTIYMRLKPVIFKHFLADTFKTCNSIHYLWVHNNRPIIIIRHNYVNVKQPSIYASN